MKVFDLFKVHPLSRRTSVGIFLLRSVVGLAFMFHGWDKIKNPFTWMGPDTPAFLQFLAALSEFGGGLAWILRLFTPIASFGLMCTMAVAVWFHAIKLGDPFASTGKGGAYEPAAVYLCVSILLLLAGAGKFSIGFCSVKEKSHNGPDFRKIAKGETMSYVDGFVLPIPKKNIKAYISLAKKAGKLWKKHGALDYKECIGDDLKTPMGIPFPKLVKIKPGETVFYSFITYKSRAHRDRVNAKVMKDPAIHSMCDPKKMPFDCKRMTYGGFKVLVHA